jgi:haloacetate dehalogenase
MAIHRRPDVGRARFFFAQPEIPERVITADPDAWYHGDPEQMGPDNHAEWIRCLLREADSSLAG